MKKFKRDLFFWIERLQITKKERVVISALLVIVVLMFGLSTLITKEYSTRSENYDAILQEFNEKSRAITEEEGSIAKSSGEIAISNEGSMPKNETAPLKVNINIAGIEELQRLNGIGKTYAQRIVDYRTKNGEFRSIEELLNIKGIGEKRLQDIKESITLK